ncbi:MAG: hypothetical protein KatS3mg127_0037 [Silanimonas sp.]|nr:MAG: hypothetical protein KatS3mg127_0037 [Silanimonas sp.]
MNRIATRLFLMGVALGLPGCGGTSPSEATPETAPSVASTGADPILPGPADAGTIDVCQRFPQEALKRVLGEIVNMKDLRVTMAKAAMPTEPGYGGCTFDGRNEVWARVEVGTAYNLHRAGLGTLRSTSSSSGRWVRPRTKRSPGLDWQHACGRRVGRR